MNMILVTLLVCLGGMQVAVGQSPEPGKCPKVTAEKEFVKSQHFGKDYVYASSEGPLLKGNPDCLVYDVHGSNGKPNDEGFLTYNYTKVTHFPDGPSQTVHAQVLGKNPDPTTLGKFDIIVEEFGEGVTEMDILKTTEAYKVIFYCKELPSDKHLSQLFVYTRNPTPSAADIDEIKSVVSKHNFDFEKLQISNCAKHVKS